MINVILTIHVLIVLALIVIVLLQRSEGGALGMGGGGSGGGFMTSRGAANALTRTTSVLAALFFATSISLAVFADRGQSDADRIEGLTGEEVFDPSGPITTDDFSRTLGADPADDSSDGLTIPSVEDAPVSVEDALDALGAESESAASDAAEDEATDTTP